MASTASSLEDGISSSPGMGYLRESSLESQLETLSLLPLKTEEDGEERIHAASGSGSNTPPLTSTVSTASSSSTRCSSGSGIILGNSGQSKKSVLDMLHNNVVSMDNGKAANAHYINTHPEVRAALQDFLSAVLLEKPEDVYAFARIHFSQRGKVPKDKLLRPLVICGPSGVGKGTLMNMLFEEFGGYFGFSVSHTTRAPRPGEVHGVHYNFTSKKVMAEAIDEGRFLEFAEVHTNLYGTSLEAVRKVQRAGKVCVLDIDVQGVMKIKQTDVNPHLVFVAPPSVEQLEARLRGRATESAEAIETRLSAARAEIEYGTAEGHFEHVVVNDELENAYAELKATLIGYYPHLATTTVEEEEGARERRKR